MKHQALPRMAVVALVALSAWFAAACSSAEDKAASEAGKPVTIGASLPLTGPFSIPGANHKKGYELCVDQLNKRGGLLGGKVSLKVSDNRSDTETVVSQTERLITVDKVDILLGTFSTLLSFPSSAIAERHQMVYPEPSDSALQSHSRGLKYNFGFTLKPIEYIGETPVDAIVKLHEEGKIADKDMPKTVAVVYQDDFFPNGIVRGLLGGETELPGLDEKVDLGEGAFAKNGMKIVYKKQFPADYNNWISLANEVKRSGADYVFALTVPPTEVELVKAFRTVKFQPKGAFFSQGTYPEFKESLGKATEGIIVWSTWADSAQWEGELNGEPFTNQDFVAAFKEKFGEEPDEDMAQAFAVCQAMANAAFHTKSLDNKKLRDWLDERSESDPVKTIQGPYWFDDKNLTAGRDVLLLQWQDGELKHVWPNTDEFPDRVDLKWPIQNWR